MYTATMFWQAALPVATYTDIRLARHAFLLHWEAILLFEIQRDWEHFLSPARPVPPLEADEHCGGIRLIAVSALMPK